MSKVKVKLGYKAIKKHGGSHVLGVPPSYFDMFPQNADTVFMVTADEKTGVVTYTPLFTGKCETCGAPKP